MSQASWAFDGSITIQRSEHPGPVSILHGSAETWLSAADFFRHSLSLSCVDRRLVLGGAQTNDADTQYVEPMGARDHVGYHVLTCGHPGDDERVIREIPTLKAVGRYLDDRLLLSVEAVTLRGELSRTDGFSADQSPWSIQIALVVPRADVPAFLRLSVDDAAEIERRFKRA